MHQAEVAAAGCAVALGCWLVHPSAWWALLGFAAAAFSAIKALGAGRKVVLLAAIVGLAGSTAAGVISGRVRTVERRWDDVREQLIRGASGQLASTLESSVALARGLADRGIASATGSQDASFDLLDDVTQRGGPESGVVVFDSTGQPWSWAGRHRLPAVLPRRELDARITPFYVVLEARRQTHGWTAIGHVVLAADSAVPDGERTVATRFANVTGAALEFYPPGRAPFRTDVFDYCLPSCKPDPGNPSPDTLFSIRTVPPTQGALKLQLLDGGSRTAAVSALACLVLLMIGGETRTRYVALGLAVGLLLFTPAGARVGLSALFEPATYYIGALDPITASAGALGIAGFAALVGVIGLRAWRPPRSVGFVAGTIVLLATPVVARFLARGIVPPAGGVGPGLWLGWEVPIAITLAALVMLAAVLLPQRPAGAGWPAWFAVTLGIGAAILGIAAWNPGSAWPGWYTYLWLPAFVLASRARTRSRQIIAAALVAGSAAATLTWTAAVEGRLRLARADADRLGSERDPLAIALLERMADEPLDDGPPRDAGDLYALWQRSPLASAGYPAVLAVWSPRGELIAQLALAHLDLPPRLLQAVASSATERRRASVDVFDRVPGAHPVLARPFSDGSVMTIGVGPKSRLIQPYRIARFLRRESGAPAPYEMTLTAVTTDTTLGNNLAWQREGQLITGDKRLQLGSGTVRHLRVTLDLGEMPAVLVRGALVLVLDALVAAVLWLVGEALLGRTDFTGRIRRFLSFRSYQVRLAVALALFFIIPTVGFSAWMAGRLRSDSIRGQDLVITQSLRDAGTSLVEEEGGARVEPLSGAADRLGTELLVYSAGALQYVSAPVLEELGLIDSYMPPAVYRDLMDEEGGETVADLSIAGRRARAGFRALATASGSVLGMPRLPDEQLPIAANDLAYALLLVTLIGLGAAAALARAAARSLAQPVGLLRSAAETIGRGGAPPPFGAQVPDEFVPVADAFTRMALDIRTSQEALEAARQQTVAVLRNVATGVIALTGDLEVALANPRAEELLGRKLEQGLAVEGGTTPDWAPVWTWAREFLRSSDDLSDAEFTVAGRRIRARASGLGGGAGCVLALDDVTELAHAVRVLAWGEIARQVAHEIKNPLTPMRLGVQHLLRVRNEGRADFGEALERTSRQILVEIDRLDAVARAFARFGAPPAEPPAGPRVPVDLVAVARETAALYALGGDGDVALVGDGSVRGLVRPDELREVLVNLVENARNAGARRITFAVEPGPDRQARIVVDDNGRGIKPEDLPRIFEPHFSTTTSGTGLGLAICRRLVESWGGSINVHSTVGQGTSVTILVDTP